MKQTFFFYDLETSGLNSRYQRIMQFAGQRTDIELNPIGEPVNALVKLSEDILPEPGAILVTGTTPQKTEAEGISEPELARLVMREVCQPGTIMTGFNNIRFDDEFIRHLLWRTFHEPYEWAYKDGRSRWDMLDVVRMTRALRPEGINWPMNDKQQPTNRLEDLSKANNLVQTQAHEALSDVHATIALARLIRQKQPKLFSYLLRMRAKNEIIKLVDPGQSQPFVYSSGRYDRSKSFTTIAAPLGAGTRPGTVLLYDLSVNPKQFSGLSQKDISQKLIASRAERTAPDFQALPVKEMAYNRCPAVAPLSVMDSASWQRLELDESTIQKHFEILRESTQFAQKIAAAYKERPPYKTHADVEGQLYDGFIGEADKPRMAIVREADPQKLRDFHPKFSDARFAELYLRYKARYFPQTLDELERQAWDTYRKQKFAEQGSAFMTSLQKYNELKAGDESAQFILEELRLWYENHAPVEF